MNLQEYISKHLKIVRPRDSRPIDVHFDLDVYFDTSTGESTVLSGIVSAVDDIKKNPVKTYKEPTKGSHVVFVIPVKSWE